MKSYQDYASLTRPIEYKVPYASGGFGGTTYSSLDLTPLMERIRLLHQDIDERFSRTNYEVNGLMSEVLSLSGKVEALTSTLTDLLQSLKEAYGRR